MCRYPSGTKVKKRTAHFFSSSFAPDFNLASEALFGHRVNCLQRLLKGRMRPTRLIALAGVSTDIVMLFMNDRAPHSLLSDKFKLGADASVAAGPVGRTAAAGTDIASSDKSLTKSANGRMATEAAWFKSKISVRKREKPKPLDTSRPSHGRTHTQVSIAPGTWLRGALTECNYCLLIRELWPN
jgi:hypothetical protein